MRRNVLLVTRYSSLFNRYLAILTRYSLQVSSPDFDFIRYLELVIDSFNDRGPYHIETSPLICKINVFSSNTGKHGPKKLRIWTIFTQCLS